MRTKEQTEHLQMVRDTIASLEPKLCDMHDWSTWAGEEATADMKAVDCGTSACIAGWAAMLRARDWTGELSTVSEAFREDGGVLCGAAVIARDLNVDYEVFFTSGWDELNVVRAGKTSLEATGSTGGKENMLAILDALIANPGLDTRV